MRGPGDIFSKRGKPLPTALQYDVVPRELRNQLQLVWEECPGSNFVARDLRNIWDVVERRMCKAHGKTTLVAGMGGAHPFSRCVHFLKATMIAAPVLDLIEIVCLVIDVEVRTGPNIFPPGTPDTALSEINEFFAMSGVGYRYDTALKQLVRVDSPALGEVSETAAVLLVSDAAFASAAKEFAEAHDDHRHGRHEHAIRLASNALESTIKIICDANGKNVDTAPTGAMLDALKKVGAVPSYTAVHLDRVRAMLDDAMNVRHNEGGHGAGTKHREVPPHLAAYALHLVASNIVYLVECHRASKVETG